jgi:hypothetical protein
MKITLSEKIIAYLALISGLSISAVAVYYSVAGLVSIFAAAAIPIIVMGVVLELSKLVATVWLKINWKIAPKLIRAYLIVAVAILMIITSMGIFGYLSKAHLDQNIISGDVMSKISIYDEKIRTAKDNIDANRKALKQMDEAVDQVMGRSSDEKGADKAVQIRRSQQKERVRLQSEIASEQKIIAAVSEERAPIAAEVRKVEAEVGPIKYIAALLYGDNPDNNLLERAVRWMIIMIVLVFDPLALTLILAANKQFEWARQGTGGFVHDEPKYEPDDGPLTNEQLEQLQDSVDPPNDPPQHHPDTHPYLKQGFQYPPGWMFVKPMVAKVSDDDAAMNIVAEPPGVEIRPFTEQEIEALEEAEEDPHVKAAKQLWKEQNPDDTLKHQRQLLSQGKITKLPWMDLIADNELPESTNTGFGTAFPPNPVRGDTFVRVDRLPSMVYKYNGKDWMEVDKNLTDSYTYDIAYIDHLIERITSGEYDAELLSETEREQVAQRLQSNTNTNT